MQDINWISVKDRLPEIPSGRQDVVVLAFTKKGNWQKASYQSDNGWFMSNSGLSFHEDEVTHWCEVTPPRKATTHTEDSKYIVWDEDTLYKCEDIPLVRGQKPPYRYKQNKK